MSDAGERVLPAHTRGGLVLVAVPHGVEIEPDAVMIVASDGGERFPARAASTVGVDVGQSQEPPLRVIDILFPDSAGEIRLGDVVSGHRASVSAGHEWGALGLPLGDTTRLRRDRPADDDVGVARASAGHRLTIETASHGVMPGDEIVLDGSAWRVEAIDRRNDLMTLRNIADGGEREVVFQRTIMETTSE